jgi:hypothetical protein
MYHDLKGPFWWTRMKRETARYVAECDTCRRVKVDHLRLIGLLQPLNTHVAYLVFMPKPSTHRMHDPG